MPSVMGRRGYRFPGLTPEKLQDSGLLSSSLPPSGPSPVVKLPRELLPFFRMSGSLGSSHSMVGPAVDGECTEAGSGVLMVPPSPPTPTHTLLSSTLSPPFATQHPHTTAWLLAGHTAVAQTAARDQKTVTRPLLYQDTLAPPTGSILIY